MPEAIGPYRVEREVGRGGMGLVYLARDPRLDRPVAIKVLPDAFAADPARLARFEREARTLAALNHQNVAAIYGLEEHDHRRVLILEYVPGPTLGKLLERGPLPVDEALRVAAQIAEGLEAAHERGVIHRDLKPENVKVTPEGIAKILDFGLATNAPAEHTSTTAATRAPGLTQQGMVIGTPGYMSPEQARGLFTDKRTDIWALGCVLFELLSGAKAFPGETATDALAAVLDREPEFTLLPPVTPGRVRELLRKCLAKDARKRMRDAGDVRIDLDEALSLPIAGRFRATGEAAADSAAQKPRPLARLSMLLPQGREIANLPRSAITLSPDGSVAAYVSGIAPDTQLFIRRLDDTEARPLPGTLGAESPTFSPDGTRLAFFADGRLKRVALSGGAPVPLAPAPRPQGVCWAADECIYFVPDWQKPIVRIHAGGGSSMGGSADRAGIESVAEPDLAGGEIALLCPEVLPGGRFILCAAYGGHGRAGVAHGAAAALDEAPIVAIDLRTLQRKPLIHAGANPRYVASGHLLFTRNGSLFAAPFDPERLEVLGTPAEVVRGILGNALGGSAHCACSADGTLIFAPGSMASAEHAILLASRAGGEPAPLTAHRGPFIAPALSPAGPRRVALQVMGPTDQLWVHDLDSGAATQLTFHADNSCPVWSPDGKHLAFRSNMGGRPELYWMPADGSGAPELLLGAEGAPVPSGFSPDGSLLVFTRTRPTGGTEIWSVKVGEPASARPMVQIAAGAWGGTISPDGRFLAFVSEQTGRAEVYVQPMAQAGAPNPQRWQVTSEGGQSPVWSRAGGEIFYRTHDAVICSRVAVEPTFQLGKPRPVAQGTFVPATVFTPNFDATPDGQGVIVLRSGDDEQPARELRLILSWFEELRRLSPHPQQVRIAPSSKVIPPRPSYNSSAGTIA